MSDDDTCSLCGGATGSHSSDCFLAPGVTGLDDRRAPVSDLEKEVIELRARLADLAERVRVDAVAEMFLRGERPVRQGDYFLLYDDMPTRLSSISSEGKWTYYDGHNCTEPFRVPRPDEYERLYTAREVAEILAASHRRMVKS